MISQIDNANLPEYQLGLLKNIERGMSKAERKRTYNWVIVQNYLLSHTRKGGSTSAYSHCRFLNIDPCGFKF